MRLVVLADLHGRLPEVPECDVLAFAGDIAPDSRFALTDHVYAGVIQRRWLIETFAPWARQQPVRLARIATPGNHDWFSAMPEEAETSLYIDEGTTIAGVSFWCTPWISPVGSWNYMLDRARRKERFADIPEKVDVLIAHSPAYNVGDMTHDGELAGCRELRAAVLEKRPAHMFFGHIHEGQRDGVEYRLGLTHVHHATYHDMRPIRVYTLPSELNGYVPGFDDPSVW